MWLNLGLIIILQDIEEVYVALNYPFEIARS